MNWAATHHDGIYEINLNLPGPDAHLRAVTFRIHDEEREAILHAIASGDLERDVRKALERWDVEDQRRKSEDQTNH